MSPLAVYLMAAAVPVAFTLSSMVLLRVGTASTRRGGSTGAEWLDAESAFEAARWRHVRWRAAMVLTGRGRQVRMPVLEPGALHGMRPVGLRSVPLARVRGSVDGGRHLFDRRFDPTSDLAWPRFAAVARARLSGHGVDPVWLVERDGDYFVLDGHHRVAVARAFGDPTVEADVTALAPGGATSGVTGGARSPGDR